MLGTAINLTTARILNLAHCDDSKNFDSHKFLLLADDLKTRIKRVGDPELYKALADKVDAIKTSDDYLNACQDLIGAMRQRGLDESKLASPEAFTKRMASIDQKTCQRFYDMLKNDYDMVTIDREAKMRTTIRSFDENGESLPLFKQDKDGNMQTYVDKSGRVRYKINKEILDFDNFNRLSKFLRGAGKSIHVNALIWHDEVPQQIRDLAKSNLPAEEKRRRCEDFLYAYINEFAQNARENGIGLGSVEVLNEIVNDDEKSQEVLRDSVWKELMGEDYYVKCYQMAKEAFSRDTKLFYNDYSEFNPAKKAKIISLVKNIERAENEQGAPLLDGIGLQCHLFGDDFDYDADLKEYLKAARSGMYSKEVRVTELDSADCDNPGWQKEQMVRLIEAAKDNGLENFCTWSDISPFVDHLENVSEIGLVAEDGKTTELHEDVKKHFSTKENENESDSEKTLSKDTSDDGDDSSGDSSGDASDE